MGCKTSLYFLWTQCNDNAFPIQVAPRVLDEFAQQARRYRSFHFEAVDNVLDIAYLKDLFPVLAATEAGYEIFYEVKANLSREQLRLMAKAGVTHIQPGIESLSSNVLRLMRKGVRAVQNVNLLRWSQYYGIRVSWNLIWGFPGETAAGLYRTGSGHPGSLSTCRRRPRPVESGLNVSARSSPGSTLPRYATGHQNAATGTSIRMASTSMRLPTFSTICLKATYLMRLTPRYGARWHAGPIPG